MEVVMRKFRTTVAMMAVALIAAACGGIGNDATNGGSAGADGIDHPSGSNEVVLRIAWEGGFVPVEMMLSRIPVWTLYGNGTVIVEGPQIEIYPPPLLPNLLATRISEGGIQVILEAARDAGLMDGDVSYPYPCVADAPTTVFTTTADGSTSVVSADALGATGPCPEVDAEARAALNDFQMQLGDLAGWLPAGAVSEEETYNPSEMDLYIGAYQAGGEFPQQPIDWPLATPLSSFGEPVEGTAGDLRCGVVSGTDLDVVLPDLQEANALTPWVSDTEEYRLIARPLLPDEGSC
jgi:hypothetical protein